MRNENKDVPRSNQHIQLNFLTPEYARKSISSETERINRRLFLRIVDTGRRKSEIQTERTRTTYRRRLRNYRPSVSPNGNHHSVIGLSSALLPGSDWTSRCRRWWCLHWWEAGVYHCANLWRAHSLPFLDSVPIGLYYVCWLLLPLCWLSKWAPVAMLHCNFGFPDERATITVHNASNRMELDSKKQLQNFRLDLI